MKAAEIRLQPPGGAFPAVDRTLAETPGVTRERVLHFEWMDDGGLSVLYEVTASDTAAVTTALDRDGSVRDHDVVEISDDTLCLFIHADRSELFAELIAVVEEHALILEGPYVWTDEGLHVTLAGDGAALQDAHERVTEHFELTIDWIGQYSPDDAWPIAKLTARQQEALSTAFELGFYETPRQASYEDVAAALDCGPSAANDLLRRSEAALVAAVLNR